jgi:cellulose synthase (UDP-forming)
VLLRRRGTFVVTPKEGAAGRQPRAVAPALAMLGVLVGAAAYGLVRDQDPATLNNVAFAALHVSVLLAGVLPALRSAPLALPGAAAVTSRPERDRARPARDREAVA